MICKNCGIDTGILSQFVDKAEAERARIAELEAELGEYKKKEAIMKESWLVAGEKLRLQTALNFEEGEG